MSSNSSVISTSSATASETLKAKAAAATVAMKAKMEQQAIQKAEKEAAKAVQKAEKEAAKAAEKEAAKAATAAAKAAKEEATAAEKAAKAAEKEAKAAEKASQPLPLKRPVGRPKKGTSTTSESAPATEHLDAPILKAAPEAAVDPLERIKQLEDEVAEYRTYIAAMQTSLATLDSIRKLVNV